MKERHIAIILAVVLGYIGIHQFYLGNRTKGVLYILFFWTLIPMLISFYDIIVLAMMDQKVFDYKYNSEYNSQYNSQYNDPMPMEDDILDLRSDPNTLDLDKLEKLGQLRESGVLTEEEFLAQKEYLLNRRY